jgi:hypothetical protein
MLWSGLNLLQLRFGTPGRILAPGNIVTFDGAKPPDQPHARPGRSSYSAFPPRAFGLAVPVSRWRQLKVAVVSATVVAVAFLFLFFGWFPRSGDLVGIFGSLLIAGLLVSTVFFWAGLVVFCNGFVRGREISNVNADAVEAQRKTQELLKRLLGGNV